MLISIIAALDRRGLIGAEGSLPWHLPMDLRRFREYTWGKPIVMGRSTFESIGKPLPGRFNIVLSRNPEYAAPGCRVVRTFQEALSAAAEYVAGTGGDEVMIIGGAKVYAEAIEHWDRLYLTVVEGEFTGATYFPLREVLRQRWHPSYAPETFAPDEKNRHPHSFHILARDWDAEEPASAETPLEGADLVAILRRGTTGR